MIFNDDSTCPAYTPASVLEECDDLGGRCLEIFSSNTLAGA